MLRALLNCYSNIYTHLYFRLSEFSRAASGRAPHPSRRYTTASSFGLCATDSTPFTFYSSLSFFVLFLSFFLSLSFYRVSSSLLSITGTSATRFWTLAPPSSSLTAFTTLTPGSGLRPVPVTRRAHLPPVRSLRRLRVRSQ